MNKVVPVLRDADCCSTCIHGCIEYDGDCSCDLYGEYYCSWDTICDSFVRREGKK